MAARNKLALKWRRRRSHKWWHRIGGISGGGISGGVNS